MFYQGLVLISRTVLEEIFRDWISEEQGYYANASGIGGFHWNSNGISWTSVPAHHEGLNETHIQPISQAMTSDNVLCRLTLDGRRHGLHIPEIKGEVKRERYESWRTDRAPWECGLSAGYGTRDAKARKNNVNFNGAYNDLNKDDQKYVDQMVKKFDKALDSLIETSTDQLQTLLKEVS